MFPQCYGNTGGYNYNNSTLWNEISLILTKTPNYKACAQMQPRCFTILCVFNYGQKWGFFLFDFAVKFMELKVKDIHSIDWYLRVSVFVIECGCGAFIAPSWSGTIALFWPMSPEGGSSIRRSRHSVCQQGLVWDWVSTATWSSEHRNAIVPPSRLWPDQTHTSKHMHARKQTHACTHI